MTTPAFVVARDQVCRATATLDIILGLLADARGDALYEPEKLFVLLDPVRELLHVACDSLKDVEA